MTKKQLPTSVWTPRNSLRLHIEQIPTSALKGNARNPRKHPENQISTLTRAINAVGFLVPCIIDENNQLINGNARVEAAERLGMDTVPCIRVSHLSDVDKRAFVIADAKITEGAYWDIEILRTELQFFCNLSIDFNFSTLGFETAEIDHFLEIRDAEPGDDARHAGRARRHAVSRQGDLWQAGPHRIGCADPLAASSYTVLLGGVRARLVIADPPHGLQTRRHRPHIVGQVCDVAAVTEEMALATLLKHFAAFSLDGALHYLGTDWQHHDAVMNVGRAVYSELLDVCIWCKPNPGEGSLYPAAHELVLVFKNGTVPHLDNIHGGVRGRSRSNVWSYSESTFFDKRCDRRPAAGGNTKPVALAIDIIKDASARGDAVLGVFGGAAATLLAAEKARRRAAVLDSDPFRVDMAVRRWQALTGKEAVCARSGATFAQRQAALSAPDADHSGLRTARRPDLE
jgi:hypothetical protein